MKKLLTFIIVVILIAAIVAAWLTFSSATTFSEKKKYLYIYTGKAEKEQVMKTVTEENFFKYPQFFDFVAGQLKVWERLKPGRYEIKNGESLLSIARKLRNNQQSPVSFVINKVRTTEDFARLVAKNFEADSTEVIDFIYNNDSLQKLGVKQHTFMTLVIPNTYKLYWNTTPGKLFARLMSEKENFWTKNNRLEKAESLGFNPTQVYIIASIVEEETIKNDEKGKIASVYINRYRTGMPLGADPTIKFALKDFAIKRVYHKHLTVESPYNTYRNAGLPPGPICTPSPKTIDAVLNAPRTDYFYFVAKNDFSGYHTFSRNYAEHLQNAKEFSKAQDEQARLRELNNQ